MEQNSKGSENSKSLQENYEKSIQEIRSQNDKHNSETKTLFEE